MAKVTLEGIGHSYDKKLQESQWPLRPLTTTFESGRSYALVGPSGCGKTTMLNIMSGLVQPKVGRVLFDDVDVTNATTAKRNVAQVFQFPAIYRSMNVYDNLAFPLICRNWDAARIKHRVGEVAEILGISDKLQRSAWRLGVDEKQLVSLGRGLVRDDVALLLMDEPLTVIDPQLKFMLRKRIKQANEVLKSTIIYVTHDQYEAMTFADELLVMSDGAVVQQGTPEQLFERPNDSYVGYFIGSPAMNFMNAIARDGVLTVEGIPIPAAATTVPNGEVQIGIRPEYVGIAASQAGPKAKVLAMLDQGNTRVVTVALGAQLVKMKVERNAHLRVGDEISLELPRDKCLVYLNGKLVSN